MEKLKAKGFKFWLNVFTMVALVLLVIFSWGQIADSFHKLADVNMIALGLLVPLEGLNFYCVAKMYQTFFESVGERVSGKKLYKISLEMNFVNNVFPSGGASGFSYLGTRLKKEGVPASKSTLAQVMRHGLTFLSFILYIFFGMLLLALFGQASRLVVLVGTSITFVIIILAMLGVYIISDEHRIKSFTAFLPRAINKLGRMLHRDPSRQLISIDKVHDFFGEMHQNYLLIKKDWRGLRRPFLWTIGMSGTEILTIFSVYLAFGSIVNPGAIILAYAVANLAGLVSILPGGIGVYEGLMTGVMASAGVARGLALSATLMYRILNMMIFLPIGYILYNKSLNNQSVVAQEASEADEPKDSADLKQN